MDISAKLAAIEDTDIDSGRFKYVLIKVYYGENDEFKYIVRGYKWAEFHADIYDDVSDRIKGLGFDTECVGGGRIMHESDKKKITVFGYSQGFGKADHSKTCEVIKPKYPGYDVSWSNEGY